MPLETLLLSADAPAVRVIRRVMQELGIALHMADTVEHATAMLTRRKFDALIADCDDLPGTDALLQRLRQGSSNRSVIVFAVINGHTTVRQAFTLGANFVFEKPLSIDRTARSLRAALGLIMRERRRYFRLGLAVTVTLDNGAGAKQQVTSVNLSESGLRVRASEKLQAGGKIQVSFTLPNGTQVACPAEVAWSKGDGNAGLRLLMTSDSVRKRLVTFLAGAADIQDPVPVTAQGSYDSSKPLI